MRDPVEMPVDIECAICFGPVVSTAMGDEDLSVIVNSFVTLVSVNLAGSPALWVFPYLFGSSELWSAMSSVARRRPGCVSFNLL